MELSHVFHQKFEVDKENVKSCSSRALEHPLSKLETRIRIIEFIVAAYKGQ